MDLTPKILQFEHATVQFRADHSPATGKVMPKLSVMMIDSYRYQWEMTVQYRHRPGDSADLYWEWSIYQHPGHRNGGEVSQGVAERFIVRFLDLCEQYPSLLFNSEGQHVAGYSVTHRARSEGFVHLATALLWRAEFSVKLLD